MSNLAKSQAAAAMPRMLLFHSHLFFKISFFEPSCWTRQKKNHGEHGEHREMLEKHPVGTVEKRHALSLEFGAQFLSYCIFPVSPVFPVVLSVALSEECRKKPRGSECPTSGIPYDGELNALSPAAALGIACSGRSGPSARVRGASHCNPARTRTTPASSRIKRNAAW